MTIPESFTTSIANQFYDKTITTYTETEVQEADGRVHKSVTENSSFLGNVSYNQLGRLMEEYGLDEKVDISVTTSTDTDVSSGEIIGYGGKHFRVLEVREADSHKLILAKVWLKQE